MIMDTKEKQARLFFYNGSNYGDPDPDLSIDDIVIAFGIVIPRMKGDTYKIEIEEGVSMVTLIEPPAMIAPIGAQGLNDE